VDDDIDDYNDEDMLWLSIAIIFVAACVAGLFIGYVLSFLIEWVF
jgi:hypothetical protein